MIAHPAHRSPRRGDSTLPSFWALCTTCPSGDRPRTGTKTHGWSRSPRTGDSEKRPQRPSEARSPHRPAPIGPAQDERPAYGVSVSLRGCASGDAPRSGRVESGSILPRQPDSATDRPLATAVLPLPRKGSLPAGYEGEGPCGRPAMGPPRHADGSPRGEQGTCQYVGTVSMLTPRPPGGGSAYADAWMARRLPSTNHAKRARHPPGGVTGGHPRGA